MDFYEWLSGAKIYIGYSNYGFLGGHGFVVVSIYDGSPVLMKCIEDLNDTYSAACLAAEYIESLGNAWIGNSCDPVLAMDEVVRQAKKYHDSLIKKLNETKDYVYPKYSKPYLLDTQEKVEWGNKVSKEIGSEDVYKIGCHVPFAPK